MYDFKILVFLNILSNFQIWATNDSSTPYSIENICESWSKQATEPKSYKRVEKYFFKWHEGSLKRQKFIKWMDGDLLKDIVYTVTFLKSSMLLFLLYACCLGNVNNIYFNDLIIYFEY